MDADKNVLRHYGVPGMKWGKKKAGGPKPTTAEIKGARERQAVRGKKLADASRKYHSATTASGKAKAKALLEKSGAQYMNNPDRKVANRVTKGEKIGYALLAAAAVGGVAVKMLAPVSHMPSGTGATISNLKYASDAQFHLGKAKTFLDTAKNSGLI